MTASKKPGESKKDTASELSSTVKSYMTWYIVAGVSIFIIILGVILSFLPVEVPVNDESVYVSGYPEILTEEIKLKKSGLSFEIPVDVTLDVRHDNPAIKFDIYFLEKDKAELYKHNSADLEKHSLSYEKNVNRINLKIDLKPDTSYVFVVQTGSVVEAEVTYELNTYPFQPYLPFFLILGIIGCVVPFVYIQLTSSKRKKLERALIKEKRRRQKEMSKMRGPIRRETPPQPMMQQAPVQQQPVPGRQMTGTPPPARIQSPEEQLPFIVQQLQVLRQQEIAVSNQLKLQGPAEQKQLLLKRYQEIQIQKQSLQQHAQTLQQNIQQGKYQAAGSNIPSNPNSPSQAGPLGGNQYQQPQSQPPQQPLQQPSPMQAPPNKHSQEEIQNIFSGL